MQIALVEGLYMLFRQLLPKQESQRGEKSIEDQDVFENSLYCSAHLINKAKVLTSFNFTILFLVSNGKSSCPCVHLTFLAFLSGVIYFLKLSPTSTGPDA
ncbi:hypothetical protein XENOCAPTIV_015271 [Xenoophorus captivus]|uniref:Uncharacterized protein n=1 Tax=Xenoophorus captivus TaxID=1517983 RepID=A0ABV0R0J4_9TELE